jgi:hypothetical protein
MPVKLERDICRDLNEIISREWLITNKLGGYAAGTVAGILTRMRHGLLVATPPTATVPYVLLAKIDEEISFDQRTYYLGTNEYQDGKLRPAGFVHLETFRLEDGFPVFTYRLGGKNDMMLEKRIWMPCGQNTTIIQYRAISATEEADSHDALGDDEEGVETTQSAFKLTLLPFATYHPYNQHLTGEGERPFCLQAHCTATPTQQLGAPSVPRTVGCTVQADPEALPLHIIANGYPQSHIAFIPTGVWYWRFLYRHDGITDDLYLPGVIRANLRPGEENILTVTVSAEEISTFRNHPAYEESLYTRA